MGLYLLNCNWSERCDDASRTVVVIADLSLIFHLFIIAVNAEAPAIELSSCESSLDYAFNEIKDVDAAQLPPP